MSPYKYFYQMNKMFLHFSDFFVETFSVILILFCRNTVETFFNVEKTLRSNSYFIELHTTNRLQIHYLSLFH